MFNLGFSELIFIGIIALVFIGPKELPEVARVVGRFLNDLRRASGELKETLKDAKDSLPDISKIAEYNVPEHKTQPLDEHIDKEFARRVGTLEADLPPDSKDKDGSEKKS